MIGLFYLGVYYVIYGNSYINLISGFIQELTFERRFHQEIRKANIFNRKVQTIIRGDKDLINGASTLIIGSIILLMIQFYYKKEFLHFLKKILFSNEVRKEISLESININYPDKFVNLVLLLLGQIKLNFFYYC